jgi:hypothetical protein
MGKSSEGNIFKTTEANLFLTSNVSNDIAQLSQAIHTIFQRTVSLKSYEHINLWRKGHYFNNPIWV